jgi:hypothetical protein
MLIQDYQCSPLEHLTTLYRVVITLNMKAELLLKERLSQSENSFAELVLWRVPAPVLGSSHA